MAGRSPSTSRGRGGLYSLVKAASARLFSRPRNGARRRTPSMANATKKVDCSTMCRKRHRAAPAPRHRSAYFSIEYTSTFPAPVAESTFFFKTSVDVVVVKHAFKELQRTSMPCPSLFAVVFSVSKGDLIAPLVFRVVKRVVG